MPIYLATYDLKTPGKDYEALWDALRQLGAKRALESVWLVNWESGGSVHAALSLHLDRNDRLLVTRLDEWTVRNTLVKPTDL